MRSKAPVIISVAAVVFMCAVIFTLSAMPADDSTALSTGVIWHIVGFIVPGYDLMPLASQLYWQEQLQFPVRKAAHFSEYALLGMLMLNMVRQLARENGGVAKRFGGIREQAVFAWELSTLYCVTDEIHQIFVDGRTFKLLDIGIDSAGALTGILVLLLALWLANRVKRRPLR